MNTDIQFMKAAIEEAQQAGNAGEIPVGAVIVSNGEIISRTGNLNRTQRNPTRHAEIIAIEEACAIRGNERLTDCELFVTKEPCAMCAGTIIHSRINRVVIAARDIKYGACGTVFQVCGNPLMNHIPIIEFGLMENESAQLLKDFFRTLREHKKLT